MKEYIVQAYAQETIDSFDAHNAPELVRCKDCKQGEPSIVPGSGNYYCHRDDDVHKPNWFCADGKRRTDND